MLSSLPKLADKAFIVGYLAPVILFLLVAALCFGDLPGLSALRAVIDSQKSFEDLTLAAAAAWFAALGLLLVNSSIYRAFEGYAGPLAGGGRLDRKRRLWEAEFGRLQHMFDALAGAPDRQAAEVAYNQVLESFRRRWPPKRALVLPTRFGNTNRAFEGYGRRVYDLDGIAVWPRLSGVIPADFQTGLTDARAQVDGFLNLSALSLALAALAVFHSGFAWCAWLRSSVLDLAAMGLITTRDLLLAIAALGAARAAYLLADNRAAALGEQVKAAFDLYLPALIKQLGYTAPDSQSERKAFWDDLAASFLSHEPMPEKWTNPRPPPPPSPWWSSLGCKKKAAPESAASS